MISKMFRCLLLSASLAQSFPHTSLNISEPLYCSSFVLVPKWTMPCSEINNRKFRKSEFEPSDSLFRSESFLESDWLIFPSNENKHGRYGGGKKSDWILSKFSQFFRHTVYFNWTICTGVTFKYSLVNCVAFVAIWGCFDENTWNLSSSLMSSVCMCCVVEYLIDPF